MRILFICTGNACRSPLAEVILRKMLSDNCIPNVVVASCGIKYYGELDRDETMCRIAAEHGYEMGGKAVPMTEELLNSADLIIVMTQHHRDQVTRLLTYDHWNRMVRFNEYCFGEPTDLRDPHYQTEHVYRTCFDIIERGCAEIIKKNKRIMKRVYKITAWAAGGIVLLISILVAIPFIKDILNPDFEKTTVYPDDQRVAPADTTFNIKGVAVKMIGIKGGKIDCRGLKETIELDDFYIGETEVTQELWTAIMGDNPSVHRGDSLPVENIDLVDCLNFVHRLDSVSEHNFNLPSYPQWLYVAHLGKQSQPDSRSLDDIAWYKVNSDSVTHGVKQKMPNDLGVYDMFGNVAEWTVSGSDPLFIVAGGSHDSDKEHCGTELREFDHCNVKAGSLGLRLVLYPDKPDK